MKKNTCKQKVEKKISFVLTANGTAIQNARMFKTAKKLVHSPYNNSLNSYFS